MEHAHKVLDVAFPARDEAPRVVQPGEEPLDHPAATIAAKGATVLGGGSDTIVFVGRNEIDRALVPQCRVEGVAVVGLVPD